MHLSKILRQLIRSEGIKISALAAKTGVPIQTLNNWLSGMAPRNISQVRKVAEYFDTTVDYLCFGTRTEKNPVYELQDEIDAGIFEVVLRRVKK